MIVKRTSAALGRLLIAFGILALPLSALATKAEAASPKLNKVIEEAKKEGVLNIQWVGGQWEGGAGLREMVEAMNNRYGTNIKAQYTPGPTFSPMLQKLIQERQAGRPASSDIYLGTANHIATGTKAGTFRRLDWNSILERPAPPDANMDRVAPEGAAVAMASRIAGIPYNTNLVKAEDIPNSIEQVFKPKWKGQIAAHPGATGLYQFAVPDMLGYEYMKKYTERLARQIGGLLECGDIERIASGEFAMLVFDCGQDMTVRHMRRGAPVGHVVPREVARINIVYFAVPEHARHPNTGILLINFLHTEEGQKLQWKIGARDLHIYPEAQTRVPVQRVVAEKGKLALDTVQRELEIGHEKVSRIRDEFVKILKESGR